MTSSQGILASAAASASYNMALQLVFRLLTFVLNAFILRHVSRDILGVVNVRLMLLYTTTLFVAREAFRRACLSKSTDRRWPQVINLLWITVPVGVVCSVCFSLIWICLLENPDSKLIPHYRLGVVMFALSTLIEICAEPLWVVGQVLLFVRLRVIIEGLALALRCISTVLFVLVFPNWGIFGFCIAQVIHSVFYTVLYYSYFIYYMRRGQAGDDFPFKTIRDLLPRIEPGKQLINPGLASLTWSFFKQSSLKQLLTEGERYVMTVFSVLSFADQGVYDIINNLGSLAARFIFLPLEDAAYLLFSHTLERGVHIKDQSKDNLELSSVVLECLLKFVVLVGMTILVFGISFAELALHIYGGHILSSGSGPMLLRSYCFYILVIAVNGVTESFVFASMSQQQVDKYNKKMLGFSIVFLTTSLIFTRYVGSVGFILANCLNMGARITHSIYYIHNYYKDTAERPLWGMAPYRPVVIAFLSSFLVTFSSMRLFCCSRGLLSTAAHVGIGAICFSVVIIVIYFTELPLINFIRDQWLKRTQKQQEPPLRHSNHQTIKGTKEL